MLLLLPLDLVSRPGSNKAEHADTPPHSFDIETTEREWTLCAESQENMQKWLRLLTRGIDEDVAILPDEEVVRGVGCGRGRVICQRV